MSRKAYNRLGEKAALFLALVLAGAAMLFLIPGEGFAAAGATQQSYTQMVPAALRPALYQTLAKDAGSAIKVNAHGCATVEKSALEACFDKQGAHFAGAGKPLSLHLVAYGRSSAGKSELDSVKPVRPKIADDEVSYAHGNLTAWWRVLPVGFEQGFTLARRPAGHGRLMLALAVNRQDANAPTKQGNILAWGKLRYGKLVVTDAQDKVIPAKLRAEGNRILIAVNDAHAAYPLTVDPIVWLEEQKLVAGDGKAFDFFGLGGLALSNKGTMAAIEAGLSPQPGRVYLFKKSNGRWAQTVTLPTPPGTAGVLFGASLAFTDSGKTLLVGAPRTPVNGNKHQGAVYVFHESQQGGWTQAGRFTPNDGKAGDGFGLFLAASGKTALISATGRVVGQDNGPNGGPIHGLVYVFTENSGTWTQAAKLPQPSDRIHADQYAALSIPPIAISGNTAVVAASLADASNGLPQGGAAYVYERSQGGWALTAQLEPSDTTRYQNFGSSVAVSGTTILVGDREKMHRQGAAYVFEKSQGTWTQTAKLEASDPQDDALFGASVALSGKTALIGAFKEHDAAYYHGAAYLFKKTGAGWTQTTKLVSRDPNNVSSGGYFGAHVALVGVTALVDDPYVAVAKGAAYAYERSNLGLALSVPQAVLPGASYVGQAIVTNSTSAVSPAVAVSVAVPAAATFVSANATQGSCSEASGVVTCDFGQISGNAGTARANVTFKAIGQVGDDIGYRAGIAKAAPALTASASTKIVNDQPPVAKDGTLTTDENTAESGMLEASDPDGDALTYSIVAQPQHGSLTLDDAGTGAYTYTPKQGYTGSDSFTFKANDGLLDSNVATVSVTVNDRPPQASDGTLTTEQNKAASGTLKATDPDGDSLTYSLVAQPQHGSVVLDDASTGAYTYTPEKGYNGSDSFTFKANDGQQDSNVATVNVTVKAAPSSGGGGATDPFGLLALALVGLIAILRRKR